MLRFEILIATAYPFEAGGGRPREAEAIPAKKSGMALGLDGVVLDPDHEAPVSPGDPIAMKSYQLLLTTTLASITLWGCSQGEDPIQPVPAAGPGAQPATPASTPGTPTPSSTAAANPQAAADAAQSVGSSSLSQMIPEDTFLWVELESFDALVEAFQSTVGEAAAQAGGGSMDPEGALMLLQMMGLPTDRLVRDQPFAVALSLELGVTEPKFSAMVPMTQAPATAAQINDMGGPAKATAMGDYVVFTNRTESDMDPDMAERFAGTRGDGLFGLRVDVARLMDRYGALLEGQIAAMAAQPKSRHAQNDPLSAGAEMGMDFVMTLAKGVKTMSMTLDIDQGELIVEGAAQIRSGSKLAELGRDETVDFASLMRFVRFDQDEVVVGSMTEDTMRFLADPIVGLLDEMARSQGRNTVSSTYEQALGMIVDGRVDFAFTASENDAAAFVWGLDSTQLMPLMERVMETKVSQFEEVTMQAPRKGQDESSRFAQYDLVANEGTASLRHFEQAFGQPRLRVRMLGNLDQTMLTIGEGETFASRTAESNDIPADVQWALSRVQNANPVMVSRTRLSGGLGERVAMSVAQGMLPAIEGSDRARDTWTTAYMAFGKTDWRMGMKVDLKALSEQMQSVMQNGAAFAQPR